MLDVRCSMLIIKCSPSLQRSHNLPSPHFVPLLGGARGVLRIQGSMLAVGCWLLDVGCWMLAVGCWLFRPASTLQRFNAPTISHLSTSFPSLGGVRGGYSRIPNSIVQRTSHRQPRLLHDVSIDLRPRHVFVPEQLLHRLDIRARLQQTRRESKDSL